MLQVNDEIENFQDKMNNITDNLLVIKNGLDSEVDKLEIRVKDFKSRIQAENYVYIQQPPRPRYDSYQCRKYGRDCEDEEELIIDNCADNLLNKTAFIESINMFLELLFTEYKVTLTNFAREIEDFKMQLTAMKMSAYLNYAEHMLNGTELIESKMADWQKERFTELEIYQLKQFFKAKELIESLKVLVNRQQKFENTISEKIKDTRLAYVCCRKSFNFEVEGVDCNRPTENATVDGTVD